MSDSDRQNFGTTAIWKIGPPIPKRGVTKENRRRESERVECYYWRPDAEDVSAAVTWSELDSKSESE